MAAAIIHPSPAEGHIHLGVSTSTYYGNT